MSSLSLSTLGVLLAATTRKYNLCLVRIWNFFFGFIGHRLHIVYSLVAQRVLHNCKIDYSTLPVNIYIQYIPLLQCTYLPLTILELVLLFPGVILVLAAMAQVMGVTQKDRRQCPCEIDTVYSSVNTMIVSVHYHCMVMIAL